MNIFLTKTGIVKLGDFGIAKVLESTTSGAMTLVGTPLYLSPEVCHNEPYGVASDLWSLGVVSYEVIALQPPFKATSLPALITKVCTSQPDALPVHPYSNDLRRAVMSFLQKEPQKRPSLNSVIRTPFASRYMKELLAHTLTTGGCEELTSLPNQQRAPPVPRRSSSHPPLPPQVSAVSQRSGSERVESQQKDEVVQQYLQNRHIAMQAKQRARGSSSDFIVGASAPKQNTRAPVQKVPEPSRERLVTAQEHAGVANSHQRPARSQSVHVVPVSAQVPPSAEDDGMSRAAMVRLKRQQERDEQDRLKKLELQKAREEALADRRIAQKRHAEQQRGALSHPVAEGHVLETTSVPTTSPEPVKEATLYKPGSGSPSQDLAANGPPLGGVPEITMRPGDAAAKYMLKQSEHTSETVPPGVLDDAKKSCEVEQLQEILAAAVCLAEGASVGELDSKLEYSSTFVSVFGELQTAPSGATAPEAATSCKNVGAALDTLSATAQEHDAKIEPVILAGGAQPHQHPKQVDAANRSDTSTGEPFPQSPVPLDAKAQAPAPALPIEQTPMSPPAPAESPMPAESKAQVPSPAIPIVQSPMSSPIPLEAPMPPEVVASDAAETVPMTSPSNHKAKGRCCSVM